MNLRVGLSVDEFLDRSFEPECELLGGETRPKPLPTISHSSTEKRLTRLLDGVYGEDRVLFELSVRIGEEVLIPDVCVYTRPKPRKYRDILDEPPLLCIEVLSPSQRPYEMLAKCLRYIEFGVPHCWVVDPIGQRAWEYHAGEAEARQVIEAFSAPCPLALSDLFE
jgi:Uma2 family endonuclease